MARWGLMMMKKSKILENEQFCQETCKVYYKEKTTSRSCLGYWAASYLNSICFVTDLRPAGEAREPGTEFLDEGLGTTGGRWISRSESPMLSAVLGSASVLCALTFGKYDNSLPLLGRVDRRLDDPDWDLCSSGGSLSCWSIKLDEREESERKRNNLKLHSLAKSS